jgi:myo-inositol-1(or 4)-monophosphatase
VTEHASSSIDLELAVAIEAARAGGRVLRHPLRRELDVELKDGHANLVTSADLDSQQAVFEVIRRSFPEHAIVGEEGTVGDPDSEHVWIVDPLDGTTNYAHGVPFFGVSVGLRSAGGSVCGAVYDPHHDTLFAAARGCGATRNGVPIAISTVGQLRGALLVTGAQSSDPAVIRMFTELVGRLMSAACGVRFLGSPALALCSIACGQVDGFCERGLNEWDICAGQLILEEAGGILTGFDGGPAQPTEPFDVVASNGLIHEELVASLPRSAVGAPRARIDG